MASFALSLTMNRVLSSALQVKSVFFTVKNISPMKILNKSGPRIEVCGTPHSIFFP